MKSKFKLGTFGYFIFLRLILGIIVSALFIHKQFVAAGILLVMSVWFDALSGAIAKKRKLIKTNKELESFADFVCFCLAPWLFAILLCENVFVTFCASVFLLAGAYRIARFNVEGTDEKGRYIGLPVTYNGYFFPCAAVISYFFSGINCSLLFAILSLILSILMISRKIRIPEF